MRKPDPPLFGSFFLGGFECTTGHHARGGWLDQVARTQHDRLAEEDYALLASVGISGTREGIRWPVVDDGRRFDFTSALPVLEAARRHRATVIWDLFHFGYPSALEPGTRAFRHRFATYAAAAARVVAAEGEGPHWFTPVNEPSYLAWAGGEAGVFQPGWRGRAPELKQALLEADLAAREAIVAACPTARFVDVDPIVRVVPPADRPDLIPAADAYNEGAVLESWDFLHRNGALDVVGVNYYWTNQWELGVPGHLPVDDQRRTPLSRLLRDVWERYRRPILVSETSHVGVQRASWMREAAQEVALCLREGIPILGLCWYPILSMPEWEDPSQWTLMGLWDLAPDEGHLRRVPCSEALAALEEARNILAPWLGERERALPAQP
ncbi:MAG TPA: hypothetical protein VFV75_00195 [Candidatus Polarisedimenticolaceae bacterium]|nr:hypothetical protein [Candidatus Polarisedimenticolaceae bacterium]